MEKSRTFRERRNPWEPEGVGELLALDQRLGTRNTRAAQGVEMTEVLLDAIRQFVAKHLPAALPKKAGSK